MYSSNEFICKYAEYPEISNFFALKHDWHASATNTHEEYISAIKLLDNVMNFVKNIGENCINDDMFKSKVDGISFRDIINHIVFYYMDTDFVAEAKNHENVETRNLQRRILDYIFEIRRHPVYIKIFELT